MAIFTTKDGTIWRTKDCTIFCTKDCTILSTIWCTKESTIFGTKDCTILSTIWCTKESTIFGTKDCTILSTIWCTKEITIFGTKDCTILSTILCTDDCTEKSNLVHKGMQILRKAPFGEPIWSTKDCQNKIMVLRRKVKVWAQNTQFRTRRIASNKRFLHEGFPNFEQGFAHNWLPKNNMVQKRLSKAICAWQVWRLVCV